MPFGSSAYQLVNFVTTVEFFYRLREVPVAHGANMFIRYPKLIVEIYVQYSATKLDLLAPGANLEI